MVPVLNACAAHCWLVSVRGGRLLAAPSGHHGRRGPARQRLRDRDRNLNEDVVMKLWAPDDVTALHAYGRHVVPLRRRSGRAPLDYGRAGDGYVVFGRRKTLAHIPTTQSQCLI